MPSWYRALDAGVYADLKYRALSRPQPNAQTLWIYILTGEHNNGLNGLYRIGYGTLADALHWAAAETRACLFEITDQGMAEYDDEANVLYLPRWIRYHPPANPKHIRGLGKEFSRVPDCNIKGKWYLDCLRFAESKGQEWVNGILSWGYTVSDTVSHTLPHIPNPNPHPNPHPNTNPQKGETRTREAPPPIQPPRRGLMCSVIPPRLIRAEDPEFWPEPCGFHPPTEAQLAMLANMADEAKCTVRDACAGAGITGSLAGPAVTQVKAWLKNRVRAMGDPKSAEAEAAKAKGAARRQLEAACAELFANEGEDVARAWVERVVPLSMRTDFGLLIDGLVSQAVAK